MYHPQLVRVSNTRDKNLRWQHSLPKHAKHSRAILICVAAPLREKKATNARIITSASLRRCVKKKYRASASLRRCVKQ
jgi:UDP-glucose 6-dehydrogenase